MRLTRSRSSDLAPPRGERLLAWTETAGSQTVGGSRHALYLPDGIRLPWEQIEAANWDRETTQLRVTEVGTWGEEKAAHTCEITEPGRLLELIRERVTASILLQRHVPVHGKRGVRVIARRSPGRPAEMAWFFQYDDGVDPNDAEVQRLADAALSTARADVGDQ